MKRYGPSMPGLHENDEGYWVRYEDVERHILSLPGGSEAKAAIIKAIRLESECAALRDRANELGVDLALKHAAGHVLLGHISELEANQMTPERARVVWASDALDTGNLETLRLQGEPELALLSEAILDMKTAELRAAEQTKGRDDEQDK